MRTAALVAFGFVCEMMLLTGCQDGATGSVSGDVYLLMQNGDVKRGAANTVLLLGPADSALAARARTCTAYGEQLLAAARRVNGPTEELLRSQAVAKLDSSLLRFTVGSSNTGINAHYRINHVPAGRYVLWAETMIGDNAYTWWAPIVIAGGDSVSKDLDNSTEVHAAFYCGNMRDSLAPVLAHAKDSVDSAVRDSLGRLTARQEAGQQLRLARARVDSLNRWWKCELTHVRSNSMGETVWENLTTDCDNLYPSNGDSIFYQYINAQTFSDPAKIEYLQRQSRKARR